jgi:hypothetical protein
VTDVQLSESQATQVREAITAAAAHALTNIGLAAPLQEQQLDQPEMLNPGWQTEGMVYRPPAGTI